MSRGLLLIQAAAIIDGLDRVGDRGLSPSDVARILDEHREDGRTTLRRTAYRWIDALEQAQLVDRDPVGPGGPASKIRRIGRRRK